MTDLVTRLRTACPPESPLGKLCSEAADALTVDVDLWRDLCELLGLDGWFDGQFHGEPTHSQIVTHVHHIAKERARLLLENISAAPALNAGPVAWRIKDFADGWIYDGVGGPRMEAYIKQTGALCEPLYNRPPPAWPSNIDEATSMQVIGYDWLKRHAPDRLTDLAQENCTPRRARCRGGTGDEGDCRDGLGRQLS